MQPAESIESLRRRGGYPLSDPPPPTVTITAGVEVRTITQSVQCKWCQQYAAWDHEAKCALRDVECEACGATTRAKVYASHAKECHVRYMECQGCKGVLQRVHLAAHAKKCAYRTVVCRCGGTMFALDYAEHRATLCPRK